MRDHGGADVDVGAQPAGVIEVLVRIDDEADRLVGNPANDLFDHREASRFAERRVEDGDEAGELDGDAVVGAAAQQVDAVGELLGLDAHREAWPGAPRRDAIGSGTHIGSNVLQRPAECVVAGADGLRAEVVVPPLM